MNKTAGRYARLFLLSFVLLGGIVLCNGCKTAGVAGLLASPSQYEKKVAAEYDLSRFRNRRIMVLVDQPGWVGGEVNLRYYLTEAIEKRLFEVVKMPVERFVSYDRLYEFRSRRSDFSQLSAAQVGSMLGADFVLWVVVDDFELAQIEQSGYHQGFLEIRAGLIKSAGGEKLWPVAEAGKRIRVGFEVGSQSRELAVKRLAYSCAYCTVRYLYNCPKNQFRMADDRSNVSWERWDN